MDTPIERGFEHFILTRFNVRAFPDAPKPSDRWLAERCELFEQICLVNVERQTERYFRWLLFFDAESPEWVRQRADQWCKNSSAQIEIVYIEGEFSEATVASEVSSRMSTRNLITTRLDNDDAIAADFVAKIQAREFRERPYALNFVDGVQVADRKAYARPYHSNPFISLFEIVDSRPLTVFVRQHDKMSSAIDIENVRTGHPMWAQMVHGSNLANEVVGLRTSTRVIEPWFQLDVRPPENSLQLLPPRTLGALRIILRLLRKPERIRVLMHLSRAQRDPEETSVRPTVVIFEPNYRGHRMDYVREVYQLARDRGALVYLATSSDSFRSDEFAIRLSGAQDAELRRLDLGELRDINQAGYWAWLLRGLREIAASVRPDQIIVLEGDKLVQRLWTQRIRGRVTVLVLRLGIGERGRLIEKLKDLGKTFFAILCRARGFEVIALASAEAKESVNRSKYSVRRVPDPVRLRAGSLQVAAYRKTMRLDSERYWFGIFGHITARKHTDLVADALLAVNAPERFGLLIAGRFAEGESLRCEEHLIALSRAGAKVILDNRLLPDAELDAAIQSVGTVVVAYDTPGPSGILSKSLAAGVHVLLAGHGIGDDSAQRDLGLVTRTELSVTGLAQGVEQSLKWRQPERPEGTRAVADPNEFAAGLLAV